MPKQEKFFTKVIQSIKKNIVAGFLVSVPFVATVFVLRFFLKLLDGASPIIKRHLDISLPGIGIIFTLCLLYLLGLVMRNVLGMSVLGLFERLIYRAPLIGTIYKSSKQLMSTFGMGTSIAYKKVVLIGYPHPGLKVVAFVTATSEDSKGNKYYHVFVPTTPNPTSGMMEIVPVEDVIVTHWSVEEAVKMVVSGGILVPSKKFDE